MSLPGDDLVPEPQLRSTRAITIQAPVELVFPWLAQLGQGRGGFYSYDGLENRLGLDIHSADRIVPELQALQPGDRIAMAPGPTFYGFVVAEVVPPTRLVFEARMHPFKGIQLEPGARGPAVHTTWAFILVPLDDGTTRVLARNRAWLRLPFGLGLPYRLLLATIELLMERRMLLGIRERAEGLHAAAGGDAAGGVGSVVSPPRPPSAASGG